MECSEKEVTPVNTDVQTIETVLKNYQDMKIAAMTLAEREKLLLEQMKEISDALNTDTLVGETLMAELSTPINVTYDKVADIPGPRHLLTIDPIFDVEDVFRVEYKESVAKMAKLIEKVKASPDSYTEGVREAIKEAEALRKTNPGKLSVKLKKKE